MCHNNLILTHVIDFHYTLLNSPPTRSILKFHDLIYLSKTCVLFLMFIITCQRTNNVESQYNMDHLASTFQL